MSRAQTVFKLVLKVTNAYCTLLGVMYGLWRDNL